MDIVEIPLQPNGPVIKKPAFKFRQTHSVSMLRQTLAENPFGARNKREETKVWVSIAEALKKAEIDAQPRSIALKCNKLLDDFDKEQKIPPRSGSEEEYGEFQVLLADVSELRKSERKKQQPGKKAASDSKRAKEQASLQQGKAIRDAAMSAMRTLDDSDGDKSDGDPDDAGTPSTSSGSKLKRRKKTTGSSSAQDAFMNVFKESVAGDKQRAREALEVQQKSLALREAELEEARKKREQDFQTKQDELALERERVEILKRSEEQRLKGDAARDSLMEALAKFLTQRSKDN